MRIRKGPDKGKYRDFQWWIKTDHSPYSDYYNGPKLKQWKINADQILWWAIRPVGPIKEETPETVEASEEILASADSAPSPAIAAGA